MKITKNLISTLQFAFTGAQQYQSNQRDRWFEVEVEFAAARNPKSQAPKFQGNSKTK